MFRKVIFFLVFALVNLSLLKAQTSQETSAIQYIVAGSGPFESLNLNTENLTISSWHRSKQSGITHVYIQQLLEGIEIFNAVGSIHLDDDHNIKSSTSKFTKVGDFTLNQAESLTTENAVDRVAEHFDMPLAGNTEIIQPSSGVSKEQIVQNASLARGEIISRLVYVPDGRFLKLAWNISFEKADDQFWWNVRVDASTGAVIDKNSWTVECNFDHSLISGRQQKLTKYKSDNSPSLFFVPDSYNVLPFPSEGLNDGTRSFAIAPWTNAPNASPFGWHDDNGAPGAEYTDTRGNNVHAQEDRDANNFGGIRPDGEEDLDFDFPLDLNMDPETYTDAATVNLFYSNNMMHDIMYQYGFDEAAGNFQTNNYGNGGLGNDHVIADSQDGSGTNNANFFTPGDGSNPRMQMFEWIFSEVDFEINTPPVIAGTYNAVGASFGPLGAGPLTNDLIISLPNDGCATLTNPGDIDQKIALVDRGNCEFDNKVANAQEAGAVAAIVCNNIPGPASGMGSGNDGFPSFPITIPSAMLSQADCDLIKNNLPVNATADWVITSYTDSDFDNGIIAHEYGHGISNRLTGGPANSNCLSGDERMGEGWSDFIAVITTMKESDLPKTARGIGTYVSGQDINGAGIRPYRYTTDLAVNPHTYDSIKDPNLSVPHGVGSVWNAMLWEMTWNLVQKYGFDPDIYSGNGGNNIALQLVLDGMKLQPCGPGFVDGRNAILQADANLYGGANSCEIWRAFAKRGLGVNADQGTVGSRTDGTEDFSLPEGCELDPCSEIDITYNNEIIPDGTDELVEDMINTTGTVSVSGDPGTSVFLSAGWGFQIEGEFTTPASSSLTINTDPCDPSVQVPAAQPQQNNTIHSSSYK